MINHFRDFIVTNYLKALFFSSTYTINFGFTCRWRVGCPCHMLLLIFVLMYMSWRQILIIRDLLDSERYQAVMGFPSVNDVAVVRLVHVLVHDFIYQEINFKRDIGKVIQAWKHIYSVHVYQTKTRQLILHSTYIENIYSTTQFHGHHVIEGNGHLVSLLTESQNMNVC